jgi:hypothetical protein
MSFVKLKLLPSSRQNKFFLSIFRRFQVHYSKCHQLLVLGTSKAKGRQMADSVAAALPKMLAGQEVAGWKAGLRSQTNF